MSVSSTEIGTPVHPSRSLVRTLNTVLRYNDSVAVSEKTHPYGRRELAAKLWKIPVTDAVDVVKI